MAGCQNSRQAQSVANSSLALPAWMLQGRQMAPIQLDSYHDVSEEAAGWAHKIDIQSDIERERF